MEERAFAFFRFYPVCVLHSAFLIVQRIETIGNDL